MQVKYTLHHIIDLRLQYSAKKKLLTAEPPAKTVVGLLMWQSGCCLISINLCAFDDPWQCGTPTVKRDSYYCILRFL